jgi:hypothetical protein
MQEGKMSEVNIPLIALPVVAFAEKLYGKHLIVRGNEKLIVWK